MSICLSVCLADDKTAAPADTVAVEGVTGEESADDAYSDDGGDDDDMDTYVSGGL